MQLSPLDHESPTYYRAMDLCLAEACSEADCASVGQACTCSPTCITSGCLHAPLVQLAGERMPTYFTCVTSRCLRVHTALLAQLAGAQASTYHSYGTIPSLPTELPSQKEWGPLWLVCAFSHKWILCTTACPLLMQMGMRACLWVLTHCFFGHSKQLKAN